MNSAMQCLARTTPLLDYFVSGDFRDELNTDNPLGTGGELAREFASLLTQMCRTEHKMTNPKSFKSTLDKHAEQFVGSDQHDSQEFASYILDALHEDTNRVLKKPYVEKPEQGPDESDADASEAAWSAHLVREDSRILEQFTGQIKSRLECPVTGNTSTTYDPSMCLSLPIPGSTDRTMKVTFVPLKGERKAFTVTLGKNSTVVALRSKVVDLARECYTTGLAKEDMALYVVDHGKVRKFDDKQDEAIDSIKDSDDTVAYELNPLKRAREEFDDEAQSRSPDTAGTSADPEDGRDTSQIELDVSSASPWLSAAQTAERARLESAGEDGEDANRVTLMDCIHKYSEREQLDDSEMWYCSQCKDHVRAWKELHIYRTPPILIIHLKRFHFSATTHRRDKIDTHVDFPLEGLDLRDSVIHREGNDIEPVYDCYAVSNHFGGLGGGHYTAYCKEDDGTWSEYDDGRVTQIDEGEIVGPAAYCLYYKRRDVEFTSKVVFEEDGDDDEESGASKGDSGDTTARRDPSAPNEDEATKGKWNISDCVQIGVDMSAEAASLLGRNFDDSARTEQTDSTGTARYPWSISECCVPEECENEDALSCLGHTFDLEEERNKGKRGLDDDVTFGDGGSSGNEEGDDDFMAKFPLPKNAGGRFVGWDGMPRQRDPERDKKMSVVFQRCHTNELSDDEEGEDFSNVDGFNKASRMRNEDEDPTRLDLGDVACAPTVTEKENGQSHVGSDDQMDWF